MDDEIYYMTLSIKNRIIDECINKFGSLGKASKQLFGDKTYMYQDSAAPKIKTILKICKECDISFDYIITGKEKKPFEQICEKYDNLVKEYEKARWIKNPYDISSNVIIYRIKHKKQNTLSLHAFLKFVYRYKKLPSYLVE